MKNTYYMPGFTFQFVLYCAGKYTLRGRDGNCFSMLAKDVKNAFKSGIARKV